jgi:hypothetical protein
VIWVIKIHSYEIYSGKKLINYFIFTKGSLKDLYSWKESRVVTTTAGDMAHVIKDSHIMAKHRIGVGAGQWQIDASVTRLSKCCIKKDIHKNQILSSSVWISHLGKLRVPIHAFYLISNGCGKS